MTKPDPRPPGPTRRSALKGAGLAGAALVAAPLGTEEAQALQARRDQRAPRFHETDHVRKFYETNRR